VSFLFVSLIILIFISLSLISTELFFFEALLTRFLNIFRIFLYFAFFGFELTAVPKSNRFDDYIFVFISFQTIYFPFYLIQGSNY